MPIYENNRKLNVKDNRLEEIFKIFSNLLWNGTKKGDQIYYNSLEAK